MKRSMSSEKRSRRSHPFDRLVPPLRIARSPSVSATARRISVIQ
jgi:hypothetical protein